MFKEPVNPRLAVIGLGYVGLPLAVAFSRCFSVVAFDHDKQRIGQLQQGYDRTLEVDQTTLKDVSSQVTFSHQSSDMRDCCIYIVTVPTPINRHKQPDLEPLQQASKTVGGLLSAGDVVIYESTVFPGATEEECVPILEQISGLVFNQTFFVGYSPERINPSDKTHGLEDIVKVTSGSTPEVARFVDQLYQQIIRAGTFPVSQIKVAEAAKVIENTQRDVNIALINELAMIFQHLGIETTEVLQAAGSKWNFLPFTPGLVGGHCIGVDPYYLTHKATELGFHPEMILAGRRLNDGMGRYVADQVARLMTARRIHVVDARILVMGLTFKENCPDLRNSQVFDILANFTSFNAQVDVFDPWVNAEELALQESDVTLIQKPFLATYDAIILAVPHREFSQLGSDKIRSLGKDPHVFYDVKSLFLASDTDGRL